MWRMHIYSCEREWGLYLNVGSPESEVVPEKLHDEGAVFVGFLAECVQLCYGFLECLSEQEHMI